MTHLNYLLARQKQDELADRAERARHMRESARASAGRATGVGADGELDVTIVLRIAGPVDSRALADLAGLDSAGVPAAPVLIAEADGQIRAAISLSDGAVIADPFHRTAAARQLLRARAAQLHGDPGTARRVRGRREPALNALPTNPRL